MSEDRAASDPTDSSPWNLTSAHLDSYASEFRASGLVDVIRGAEEEFERTVIGQTDRGDPYGFAGMRPEVAVRLYGLIRELKPGILVETGVCNGVSTAVVLAALERNRRGRLYSIDLPEFTDTRYAPGTFWEGKKGAAVPKGRQPGWLIPARLRQRWHLTLGRSQRELPRLLDRLGTIDFFMHDSEHSIECMLFEYRAAWPYLRPGGILASDDVGWNTAFRDFSAEQRRRIYWLGDYFAFVIR